MIWEQFIVWHHLESVTRMTKSSTQKTLNFWMWAKLGLMPFLCVWMKQPFGFHFFTHVLMLLLYISYGRHIWMSLLNINYERHIWMSLLKITFDCNFWAFLLDIAFGCNFWTSLLNLTFDVTLGLHSWIYLLDIT